MKQFFDEGEIIDSYRFDEFWALHSIEGSPICDFLPHISMTDPDLQKWKDWFTKKKQPWVVKLKGMLATLWKLDQRLTPREIDAERRKPGVRWFVEG